MDLLLTLIAVALLVPLAVLTVECLAALLPAGRSPEGPRPVCAILIPAHDEEAGLPATLAAVWPELVPGDRLLVVADNCMDRTASIARRPASGHPAGAEVLERFDLDHRGKGYALAAGVDALRAGAPDVVIVIDADCRPAPGAIDRLARTAATTGRPVQAAYSLAPPDERHETRDTRHETAGFVSCLVSRVSCLNLRTGISAWAVRVKNVVRPRGLRRLGLPCLLTGSGMAFPWKLLRDAPLASGDIVEDMRLGVDLAVAGHPPTFESAAVVTGELPLGGAAARSQRTRWEHGHLSTLTIQAPRLLVEALRQGRLDLAALALELAVPPLSVLGFLWMAAVLAALTLATSALPAQLLLYGGWITITAGLLAWAAFGRAVLPPAALLAAPVYALAKLPMYLRFLVRRQRAWVRTPRDRGLAIHKPKTELR